MLRTCSECGQKRKDCLATHQLVSGKILYACGRCWHRLKHGDYLKGEAE